MNLKLFLKQYVKMFAQTCVLPLCYQMGRRKKVRPELILFADAHHNSRPENMELLYEYLQQETKSSEDGPLEIREFYLDYQKASPGAVLQHMISFMQAYAQAGSVVICDNFLPVASCCKRKETKVVQLWHACGAFKKFGYDTPDDIPANYHGNVFRNMDLVTVSAPCCVAPFASAMRLSDGQVQPMGVSRTDLYFQQGWRERCRQEFAAQYPQARGKKIVLWAPTFRGNPGQPQPMRLGGALDLDRLQQELGEDYLVLVRLHPHMAQEPAYAARNCPIPTERLFPVTDVLIADYSSLIFEYLLFQKPLVLYVPDLQEYQKNRGFYLNFDEIPGCQVTEEKALAAAIRQEQVAYGGEKNYNEKRNEFVKNYMSACDGQATKRIAEYITAGKGGQPHH